MVVNYEIPGLNKRAVILCEVDGLQNSLVEVNCEPLPWGPDNPSGTFYATTRTFWPLALTKKMVSS